MVKLLLYLSALIIIILTTAGCADHPDDQLEQIQQFTSGLQDKALTGGQPQAETLFLAAMNAYDAGRIDEALRTLDKVVELNPHFILAWFNKSLILINQKKYREANDCCDKAIAVRDNYGLIWINKSVALLNLGRYDESVGACDKAIALEPQNANPLINKGIALWKLKRLGQAIKAFDAALAIDENRADAWYIKAFCYAAQKRNAQALACMQQAVKMVPQYQDEINKEPALKKIWDANATQPPPIK